MKRIDKSKYNSIKSALIEKMKILQPRKGIISNKN